MSSKSLLFNSNRYSDNSVNDVKFRAYTDIPYVLAPIDPIQKLNIFVPIGYIHNQVINGYSKEDAPIFMPNTVGGYMPGPRDFPGNTVFPNNSETICQALKRGYVVVSAGLRGRTQINKDNKYIGKAPAFIVDMKAAIRYIKYNKDRLPAGNVNKIITNGTSAGGATSALVGTSGNNKFFENYLDNIGAADVSDNIFAASVYCPIHNLEHADMAYEWEFFGIKPWSREEIKVSNGNVEKKRINGTLSEEEVQLSSLLKNNFVDYVNELKLKDEEGKSLVLDSNGNGSFKDWILNKLVESAQKALDNHENLDFPWIKIKDKKVLQIDWDQYIRYISRMKSVPAFDGLNLETPENSLFGTENVEKKHFTEFSKKHSHVNSSLADIKIINAINPTYYIGKGVSSIAPHWRIRHGASDRDTSFAIPAILALLLKNNGYDVNVAFPWGKPHSGDYDLEELFDWIDNLCK